MTKNETTYGTIASFNEAPTEQLVGTLEQLFGSHELARMVAECRPFVSVEHLRHTAGDLLDKQGEQDVLNAINAHPAIGARVKSGSLSEKEQAAANTADEQTRVALERIRELAQEYSARHGFTFLIKASGLSAQQILDNLQKRMNNSTMDELQIARQHLAGINDLRLSGLFV